MPKLAVMETAEWYEDDMITSIRPMLPILAQLEGLDASDFSYSTFVNEGSFKSTLCYFSCHGKIKYIYIGCHGSEWEDDKLETPSGDTISRTEILNRIMNKPHLRGVFLSVCNSDNIAHYIAEYVSNVIWVAGYGEEVDWIKSCAFELMFWQKVFDAERQDLRKIGAVNHWLRQLHDYTVPNLSLEIWLKKTQNSDAIELLSDE